MKMSWKLLLAEIVVMIGLPFGLVQARWLDAAEANFDNSYTKTISINADGTYAAIVEWKSKVLTENGRASSNIVRRYQEDRQTVEILEAKAIRDNKEYLLDKKLIEDKPLASSYEGFDQERQILFAFPRVEVGTVLYVKYKLTVKDVPLKDFYGDIFYFCNDELVTNARVKIISRLPLHILVNDPDQSLKVTESKEDGFHNLNIVLTKPVCNILANEPNGALVNEKRLTWVSISTLNDWKSFAVKYGNLWRAKFVQDLPSDFDAIVKQAREKKGETEQINTVTSLLNDKVRYMGDWRSVKGAFVPRSLEAINKTQLGDCKDFAIATAVMLTKLGFKVQIAAVVRGVYLPSLSNHSLPRFSAVNHVIIRVTSKSGRVYWIDPTNFASMAGGIFPDIAGKMAVILDPSSPDHLKIPDVDPLGAVSHLNRQWQVKDGNTISEVGELCFKNEYTLGLTGILLRTSANIVKDSLFYFLADDKNIDEKDRKDLKLPALNSRIVGDLCFPYGLERKKPSLTTNVGSVLRLVYPDQAVDTICNIAQDVVSDVLIDAFPCTRKRVTVIKNANIPYAERLNRRIVTPWVAVERKCSSMRDGDLRIEDTIIVHKHLVTNEEIKKSEFLNLKNWLETHFKDVAIVKLSAK